MGACDSRWMVCNFVRGSYFSTNRLKTINAEDYSVVGAHHSLAATDDDCSWCLLLSSMAAPPHCPEQSGVCSMVRLPDCLHSSSGGHAGWVVCTQLRNESSASPRMDSSTKSARDAF